MSPSIVYARLQLASAGQCLAGGLRRSHDVLQQWLVFMLLPFVLLVIGLSAFMRTFRMF